MRTSALALALISFSLLGCSGNPGGVGPGMEAQEALMKDAGDLLRCGTGNHAKLADLAPFEANFPKAFQALKSGDIVVNWGTAMLGEGESAKAPQAIIAHDKEAQASGGWVMFTNGTAKKVTAAEFSTFNKK